MENRHITIEKLQALQDMTQTTIYLMGGCFILGSLFTIFLLLILDFMRRNKAEGQ